MMMKMNNIFSINTILRLAAGAILAATLFLACSNLGGEAASAFVLPAGGPNAVGGQDGAQAPVMVTVNGSLAFGGAMPSEIAALVAPVSLSGATRQSFDNTSRSAFPQTPSASGLTITVYAEEVTESETKLSYNGTVTDDGSGNVSYTVGIPVTSGKKYRVHAVAKSGGVEVFSGKSALLDFTENAEQFYTSCDITLGAGQSATGKGCVELYVDVQNAGGVVKSAQMGRKLIGSDTPQVWVGGILSLGSKYKFSKGWIEDGVVNDGLASGNYLMTFEFYSGTSYTGELLYSFTECVSVFDGLVTDTWVKNGSEPWLDGSGCQITSAMIDGFGLTEIYVDTSRQTTNPNAEDGSYTTESGTFLNPKRSFTDALAMLQDASKGYTIFIKGTIGPQTIPDTLKNSGSGGVNTYYAKSLTLCGAGDPDASGVPTDIIDADDAAGTSALTIATTVPVTIKNLMITNGTGTYFEETITVSGFTTTFKSYRGGGIYLSAEGGSLTLGRGAYVSGNNVTSDTIPCYGGGICLGSSSAHSSELNLMDGAVIARNDAKNYGGGIYLLAGSKLNIYDGAVMEKNNAQRGGAIYISGSLEIAMSGGHIRGNTAVYGGAVYGERGTFTMTGGVIGDDSSTIIQAAKYGDDDRKSDYSNTAQYGGAFYFASSSAAGGVIDYRINLYGGTIAYNCAQNYGGAFYIKNGLLRVKNTAIKYNGAGGVGSKGGGAICFETEGHLWLEDGADIDKNECYNAGALGGAIYIGQGESEWNQEYVYIRGDVSIPCYGAQKNDVGMLTDSSMPNGSIFTIVGKLTGTEPVATITPAVYSAACQVVKLFTGSSPEIDVTDVNFPLECYKFAVTPQVDGGVTKTWIVASTGMLAKVVRVTASEAAAAIPSLENGDILQITGEITGTRSSGLAGGILTALQASPASVKITLDLSKCTNTTMANNCFEYCSCIDNVILPPNLTEVPNSMFSECHLTSVTFPSALESIGSAAFNKCDFTSITIPNTVKTVGDQAFANNASLTTVSMSNSVTSLGEGCFANCSELTSVTFSNKITELPAEVFLNCSRLRMYSVPGNVTTLGDRAFCGTGCTNFEVNTKVTSLGAELFKNTSIQRVTILGNFTWYCNDEVVNANFAADNAERLKVNEYPWTRG